MTVARDRRFSDRLEVLLMQPHVPNDLGTAFDRIINAAQELFQPDCCALLPISPFTQKPMLAPVLRGNWHTAVAPDELVQTSLLPDQSIQFLQEPTHLGLLGQHEGFHAAVIIPITLQTPQTEQHGSLLALLYLAYRSHRLFNDLVQLQIATLSGRATLLLRQIWPLHRMAEIARIGHAINQELSDVEELFDILQRESADVLDTSHLLMLSVYQRERGTLDVYIAENGFKRHIHDHPLMGLSQQTLEHKVPLLISNLAESDWATRVHPVQGSHQQEQSLIFVPLLLRGLPIGVLSIQQTIPNAYDAEDQRIMQLLSNHVTMALGNIRLFEQLEQLDKTGQLLLERLDQDNVLPQLAQSIRQASDADLVLIYLHDGQSLQMPPQSDGEWLQPSYPQDQITHSDHVAELILQQRTAVFAHNSADLYKMLGGNPQERKGFFERREQIRSTAALPLRVGETVVGVLFVNFRQQQRFDAPQCRQITTLASYTALAIQTSRQFIAQKRRRLNDLELLQQIDEAIAHPQGLKQTLENILALAMSYTSANKGAIYLHDEHQQVLIPQVSQVHNMLQYEGELFLPTIDHKQGLIWLAFDQCQAINAPDVRDRPWSNYYIDETPGIHSELDTPMLQGGLSIGVINLESLVPSAFSKEHEQFLKVLAGRAVLAIRSVQAKERKQRLEDERRALIDISSDLVHLLEPQQIFKQIMEQALHITKSESGTLMLYEPDTKQVRMAASAGVRPDLHEEGHSIDEGIVGWVVRNRQAVNVGDVTLPPWKHIHLEYIPNIRSELAVPLLDGKRLLGVINVESQVRYSYTEGDQALLEGLADLAVIALRNAEQYQQLQLMGQVDANPEQVIYAILDKARELTGAETATLHLYSGSTPTSVYLAQQDLGTQQINREMFDAKDPDRTPEQPGIVDRVAHTREPYRTIGDAQQDPFYRGRNTAHSELAIPMFDRSNQFMGVLNLESYVSDRFTDAMVNALQQLAVQATIAITIARVHLRLKLVADTGQKLAAIVSAEQLEQAYQIVISAMQEAQPGSQISIRRYDSLYQTLTMVAWIRNHTLQPPEVLTVGGRGVNGLVTRTRKTQSIPDVHNPPEGIEVVYNPYESGSLICTPIQLGPTAHDPYYGNLTVTLLRANQVLEIDQVLLGELARQLALTLYRLETEQQVRESTVTSLIGQVALELAHRLGNNLGMMGPAINAIRRELNSTGSMTASLDKQLERLAKDKEAAAWLITKMKNDLGRIHLDTDHQRTTSALSVRELLAEVVRSIADMQDTINIVLQPVPDELAVQAIQHEVVSILHNLLTNAIEAMPNGGQITLRVIADAKQVVIEVVDNGPGIEPRHQKHIFDLLFSTKGSSGFGLWNARRRARENGGDLTVESLPGEGTTFLLTLPRAE